MKTPFFTYNNYMKEKYGMALFRVPIDLGFTCPNRNKNRKGGCSFCSENGSKAIQTKNAIKINDQIKQAVFFAKKRYNAKKFIAYIQAFSAQFNQHSQKIYSDIINSHKFSAISIGTRPDLITATSLNILKLLNKQIPTYVELGIQTSHNKTLKKINRGHHWQCSKTAIKKLKMIDVNIIVHIIIGLPGETKSDIINTAKRLSKLPITGIKIHNLHILKNTKLAKEYQKNAFPLYNEYEYAEILMEFLRYIPANVAILRMNTDSLPEELIAPIWNMSKLQFKEYLKIQMALRLINQGDKLKSQIQISLKTIFPPVKTNDGSITYWNNQYKEHYHTQAGARLEAIGKYIEPSKLKDKINRNKTKILDICFGLGYNSLESINLACKEKKSLSITALESDKKVVISSAHNIINQKTDNFNWKTCLESLATKDKYKNKNHLIDLKINWGDARYTITKLKKHSYDVVFLDAFSTIKNSELWTYDFFLKIKAIMKKTAVLLTYSAAYPVRSGLIEAGFYVGETKPIGRKRTGTIASLCKNKITHQIPLQERSYYKSTRGVLYRDPYGVWTNKEILRDRQNRIEEQKTIFRIHTDLINLNQ